MGDTPPLDITPLRGASVTAGTTARKHPDA
jgi:hypothetical protein